MKLPARWKMVLSIVVLAVVVAIAAWYIVGHRDDFKRVLEIGPASFAELSALCLIAIWISGLHVSVLVKIFGARLGGWEAFGLSAANTMANFYFTKGGMATKGLYLKRIHGFSYTHFLSTLAGAYVVSLVTYGTVGLILYLISGGNGQYRIEIFAIFGALIAGGLLPLALPRMHGRIQRFLPEKVQRVMEGWEQVRRHRSNLATLSALTAVYVIVGGLRLFVSYKALGYAVTLLPCLVIATLQSMTVIFTVTPGAVGVRQALVGYGSEMLDIGATEGVVASTIDHGVGTLWVFIIGIIFTNYIWVRHVKPAAARDGGEEPER